MKPKPQDKKAVKTKHKSGDEGTVAQHRPLRGRTIFLHLHGYKGAAKFEDNIKLLGAVVEKCFSREVHILITSQGLAKDYERSSTKGVATTSAASPATPSPFNLATLKALDSPQPDSPGDGATKKPLTRGQKIAAQAKKTQNRGSGNVVENAKLWKIRTIHIDQAQNYVERELQKIPEAAKAQANLKKGHTSGTTHKPAKPKHKVKRLQGSFIKFESCTRHYRPLMQSFKNYPVINTNTPLGTCPFEVPRRGPGSGAAERDLDRAEREERDKVGEEDEDNAGLRQLEEGDTGNTAELKSPQNDVNEKPKSKVNAVEGCKKYGRQKPPAKGMSSSYTPTKLFTKGELRRIMMDKIRAEQKRGFCEACEVKYEDIDKHVRSDHHRKFARDATNYTLLDELIEKGPNMEQFLNDVVQYHDLHLREALIESQAATDCDDVLLMTSPRTPRTSRKRDASKQPSTPVTRGKRPSTVPTRLKQPTTPISKVKGSPVPSSGGRRNGSKSPLRKSSRVLKLMEGVNEMEDVVNTLTSPEKLSTTCNKNTKANRENHGGEHVINTRLDKSHGGKNPSEQNQIQSNAVMDNVDVIAKSSVMDSEQQKCSKNVDFKAESSEDKTVEKLVRTDSHEKDRGSIMVNEMKSLLGDNFTVMVDSPRRARTLALNENQKPKSDKSSDSITKGVSSSAKYIINVQKSSDGANVELSDVRRHKRTVKDTCVDSSKNVELQAIVNKKDGDMMAAAGDCKIESPRTSRRGMLSRHHAVRGSPDNTSTMKKKSHESPRSRTSTRIKHSTKDVLDFADDNMVNHHPVVSKQADKSEVEACKSMAQSQAAVSGTQNEVISKTRHSRRLTRSVSVTREGAIRGGSGCEMTGKNLDVMVRSSSMEPRLLPTRPQPKNQPIKELENAEPSEIVSSPKSQKDSEVVNNDSLTTPPKPLESDLTAMSPWDRRPRRLMGNTSPRLIISPLDERKLKLLTESGKRKAELEEAEGQESPVKPILKEEGARSPSKKVHFRVAGSGVNQVQSVDSAVDNKDMICRRVRNTRSSRYEIGNSSPANIELMASHHGQPTAIVLQTEPTKLTTRSKHNAMATNQEAITHLPEPKNKEESDICDSANIAKPSSDVPQSQGKKIPVSPRKRTPKKDCGQRRNTRVKLRSPWRMASKRSISQLLSSEGEDEEDFAGFDSRSQSVSELPTDMSYEEVSEVEVSERSNEEWVLEEDCDEEHAGPAVGAGSEASTAVVGEAADAALVAMVDEVSGMIGEPPSDSFIIDPEEIVPASDNSTDTQPSSPIKLPPINLKTPLKFLPVPQAEIRDPEFSSPIKIPRLDNFLNSPCKDSEASDNAWDTKVDSFLNQVSDTSALFGQRSMLNATADVARRSSPRKLIRNPLQELDQILPESTDNMWVSSPKGKKTYLSPAGKRKLDKTKSPGRNCHNVLLTPAKRCLASPTAGRGIIGGPKHSSTPYRPTVTDENVMAKANTKRRSESRNRSADSKLSQNQTEDDSTWFDVDGEVLLKSPSKNFFSVQPGLDCESSSSPPSGAKPKARRSLELAQSESVRRSPRKSANIDISEKRSGVHSLAKKIGAGMSTKSGSSSSTDVKNINYLRLTKKYQKMSTVADHSQGNSPSHGRQSSTHKNSVNRMVSPKKQSGSENISLSNCNLFESPTKVASTARRSSLLSSPDTTKHVVPKLTPKSKLRLLSERIGSPKVAKKQKPKSPARSSPGTNKYHVVPKITPNKRAALIASKSSTVNLDNSNYKTPPEKLTQKRKHSDSDSKPAPKRRLLRKSGSPRKRTRVKPSSVEHDPYQYV